MLTIFVQNDKKKDLFSSLDSKELAQFEDNAQNFGIARKTESYEHSVILKRWYYATEKQNWIDSCFFFLLILVNKKVLLKKFR